jgi:hypothetical protein
MYFTQRIAQERHALGQKTLLRSQPKRSPSACRQKSSAIGSGVVVLLPTDGANMFVRGAITILTVLCAHPVAILGNLAGDPIRLRKGCDHVTHQLRFADAPRVPADYDHSPVLFTRPHLVA